jgi:pyrimidine deaminase RibD-like protein
MLFYFTAAGGKYVGRADHDASGNPHVEIQSLGQTHLHLLHEAGFMPSTRMFFARSTMTLNPNTSFSLSDQYLSRYVAAAETQNAAAVDVFGQTSEPAVDHYSRSLPCFRSLSCQASQIYRGLRGRRERRDSRCPQPVVVRGFSSAVLSIVA